MKKTLTISDLLTLLVIIIGWAISVEVRLATHKVQIDSISTMSEQINEMYEKVIVNETNINNIKD